MKTIICDKCKKTLKDWEMQPVELSFLDKSRRWDYFWGKVHRVELCDECFNEFKEFLGIESN